MAVAYKPVGMAIKITHENAAKIAIVNGGVVPQNHRGDTYYVYLYGYDIPCDILNAKDFFDRYVIPPEFVAKDYDDSYFLEILRKQNKKPIVFGAVEIEILECLRLGQEPPHGVAGSNPVTCALTRLRRHGYIARKGPVSNPKWALTDLALSIKKPV